MARIKTRPNPIIEYYQAIEDGSIPAGKWIRLLYDYIVDGLLSRKIFHYEAKKANAAIEFIENYCHHHEGKLAPQKIKLELWQKAMICCMFGIINNEDGLRQFREVLTIIARKNGKTLLAAAIADYMLYLDDYGARVYFVAPKLDQARLCYNALYQMIEKEPELSSMTKKRRTDIYVKDNNATAQPIAFSARKSDGLNPSFTVCDEISSWHGDAGLKQYEVLKSALGAREQPIIFSITTSGYENDGIYDELVKRSTRFLLGESKETRLLPFLYMIDDPSKWNDLNELAKANPNMGVSVKARYLADEAVVAESSLSKKREFMTKYCCVKQNSSLAWLSSETVAKAYTGKPLRFEDYERHYAVGGIDLSQTTDLTAAVLIVEDNGMLHVFSHFWLPSARIEEAQERDGVPYDIFIQRGFLSPSGDNFVDYHDCYKWFTDIISKYKIYVLQTGYDRYSAQYLVQDMQAYGFHMDDVYQGDNLWPVIQEMEGLMKDGRIDIGDNDLLKSHLLNTAVKMSQERGRGKIVKIAPTDHIDGTAALLDALTVRQKWYPEIGKQLENHKFDKTNKEKETA